MRVTDLAFGLVLAGLAAVALLLFSDDPLPGAVAAVAACFAIGAGWSSFWRWYDGYVSRRGTRFSLAGLPWTIRALLYALWLAVVLGALAKIADMLFLQEQTAQVVFFVLFGLGAVVIVLGELATRDGARDSGRPSRSS